MNPLPSPASYSFSRRRTSMLRSSSDCLVFWEYRTLLLEVFWVQDWAKVNFCFVTLGDLVHRSRVLRRRLYFLLSLKVNTYNLYDRKYYGFFGVNLLYLTTKYYAVATSCSSSSIWQASKLFHFCWSRLYSINSTIPSRVWRRMV